MIAKESLVSVVIVFATISPVIRNLRKVLKSLARAATPHCAKEVEWHHSMRNQKRNCDRR